MFNQVTSTISIRVCIRGDIIPTWKYGEGERDLIFVKMGEMPV